MSDAGDHFRKEIEAIKWLDREIEYCDQNSVSSITEINNIIETSGNPHELDFLLEDHQPKNLQQAFLYSELKKRLESKMEKA